MIFPVPMSQAQPPRNEIVEYIWKNLYLSLRQDNGSASEMFARTVKELSVSYSVVPVQLMDMDAIS